MPRIAHSVIDNAAGYATGVRAGRHKLNADEPASRGGTDAGPSPYELLLAGLGACTAITLRMYADRKGWQLGTIHVDLELHKHGEGDTGGITRPQSLSATLQPEQKPRLPDSA